MYTLWVVQELTSSQETFVYPLFISDKPDDKIPISSMPGQFRLGINQLSEFLAPLIDQGLASVILFGVINDNAAKNAWGDMADAAHSPVIEGIQLIRAKFPSVYIMSDVCLCEYTDHGHCGILHKDGSLDNSASVSRLTEVASRYAEAGAHCVAPSDMNDCRVAAIKKGLLESQLAHQVAVMAYSAKFHSALYGPFREAAASQPAFGDRKCYQLPPGARGLARRAIHRDLDEGADIILVKPAGSYLDIIRDAKEISPDIVVAAYQVSGEYLSLHAAAEAGVASLKELVFESCEAMVRAGATVIISYYTPNFLQWLSEP
jgi:porphobilinogen synthase